VVASPQVALPQVQPAEAEQQVPPKVVLPQVQPIPPKGALQQVLYKVVSAASTRGRGAEVGGKTSASCAATWPGGRS
jgi:hypothetical protein